MRADSLKSKFVAVDAAPLLNLREFEVTKQTNSVLKWKCIVGNIFMDSLFEVSYTHKNERVSFIISKPICKSLH
jgi:hypothetical protein